MSREFWSYLEQADSVVEKWQSEISSKDVADRLQKLFSNFKAKLDALPNLKPEQKAKLEEDLRTFLFDSVSHALKAKETIHSWREINTLARYNREEHDTDREKWLDAFELERYVRTLDDALAMITELWWIDNFRSEMLRIHKEIEGSPTMRMSLMGTRHEKAPYAQAFAEMYASTMANLTKEEALRLQNVPFSKNPAEFFQWLSISIGTKLPAEAVELVGKFVYDTGKAILQFPEYLYFAYRFEKAGTATEKFEFSEKMKSRLDDNLGLGLLALVYDGTADVTWNMFGWEWKISADAQGRRLRELMHSIGTPNTWTPEWVKDAVIAIVPFLPKLIKEMKALQTQSKQETRVKNEAHPRAEDIPRETPRLRSIEKSEHLKYAPEQLNHAAKQLRATIGEVRYNSLDRVIGLLREHEKDPSTPLLTKYKDLKIEQPAEPAKSGGDCTVMSLELQAQLKMAWIDSKVVRFLSNNLLNERADAYVGDSHSALVIPRMKMGTPEYVLLDPWLFIHKAIPFHPDLPSLKTELWWGKWAQVIPNPEKWQYPNILLIWGKDGKLKKLPFDPTKELMNPHETLSKDLMRWLSDFKLVKQSPEWVPIAVAKVDLKDWIVTLQLWSAGKSADRIPFHAFESEILKPETQKKLEATARILGETQTSLTDKIRIIIRNADAYKNEIWNPSTRKEENSQTPTPWAK